MDTAPLKDAFWNVVADCLHEFHEMPCDQARLSAMRLRQRVDSPSYEAFRPVGYDPEMIYHAEPFDVAADLAGRPLELGPFEPQYDRLIKRHFEPGERAALASEDARIARALRNVAG